MWILCFVINLLLLSRRPRRVLNERNYDMISQALGVSFASEDTCERRVQPSGNNAELEKRDVGSFPEA